MKGVERVGGCDVGGKGDEVVVVPRHRHVAPCQVMSVFVQCLSSHAEPCCCREVSMQYVQADHMANGMFYVNECSEQPPSLLTEAIPTNTSGLPVV